MSSVCGVSFVVERAVASGLQVCVQARKNLQKMPVIRCAQQPPEIMRIAEQFNQQIVQFPKSFQFFGVKFHGE